MVLTTYSIHTNDKEGVIYLQKYIFGRRHVLSLCLHILQYATDFGLLTTIDLSFRQTKVIQSSRSDLKLYGRKFETKPITQGHK